MWLEPQFGGYLFDLIFFKFHFIFSWSGPGLPPVVMAIAAHKSKCVAGESL
jgi:hypothetical protein